MLANQGLANGVSSQSWGICEIGARQNFHACPWETIKYKRFHHFGTLTLTESVFQNDTFFINFRECISKHLALTSRIKLQKQFYSEISRFFIISVTFSTSDCTKNLSSNSASSNFFSYFECNSTRNSSSFVAVISTHPKTSSICFSISWTTILMSSPLLPIISVSSA